MLICTLICPVLIVILNIFTNNELIMTIIIDSFKDSCILIGGIFGCIGMLMLEFLSSYKSNYNMY